MRENKGMMEETDIFWAKFACVFKRVDEAAWGLFHNMAPYPLLVNGIDIRTSEALYQACRFPLYPDIQKEIIDCRSPMGVKMKSKHYRKNRTRPDWEEVKVDIMYWCLCLKLSQYKKEFGGRLLATENADIVEDNKRDKFWGAAWLKDKPDWMQGRNELGKQLMRLREAFREDREQFRFVEPLAIPDFKLFGENIQSFSSVG